jgi:site-specific recombinase XerD
LASKHTDRAYLAAVHDFDAWCARTGIASVAELNPERFADYLGDCAGRLSPASIKQRAICVRKVLVAISDDPAAAEAFRDVPLPKVASLPRRPATIAEATLERLIHVNSGATLKALRDRAILAFLVTCFLPVQVLCRLRTGSYQRNRKGVWLHVGRWGHPYPCPGSLAQCLDAYMNAGRIAPKVDAYLFRSIAGASAALTERPLTQPDVYRIVQSQAKAAGLTGINARELRATGLTRFFTGPRELPGALEIAMNLAVHRSWRSAIRYAPPDARLPRMPRRRKDEWGDYIEDEDVNFPSSWDDEYEEW